MQDVEAPRGVAALGLREDDVPVLVDGACKQQRLLAVAPKEVGAERPAPHPRRLMHNW